MSSRYGNRNIKLNNDEQYRNLFKNRGLKLINQYTTPKLKYPSEEELEQLELTAYTWSIGDRLYKLAFKYYGDSELWWIIAFFNHTPTESHIKVGDIIYIPTPLDKILDLLDI